LEWSVAARGSGGAEWSVAEEVSLPYLPDYHTTLNTFNTLFNQKSKLFFKGNPSLQLESPHKPTKVSSSAGHTRYMNPRGGIG
jgi:hypothetical protein